MLRPGIQNDFAFYRRTLHKHLKDLNLPVSEVNASHVSKFFAPPNPVMYALSEALKSNEQNKSTVEQVGSMANVCLLIIKGQKFPPNSPNYFLCLRTMCACIILYDMTDPEGAFRKGSSIRIKPAINMLVNDFRKQFPKLADPGNLIKVLKVAALFFVKNSLL